MGGWLRQRFGKWAVVANIAAVAAAVVLAWVRDVDTVDGFGKVLLLTAAVPGLLGTWLTVASLFPGTSQGYGFIRTDWQHGNAPWERQVEMMEGHLDGIRLASRMFVRGWLLTLPALLAGAALVFAA